MNHESKIVIIGAGLFGLSIARQLAAEGYRHIVVLDRHMPPVPGGSSSDISRVVRFDYADENYLSLAHEAYLKWRDDTKYRGIFFPSAYIVADIKNGCDQTWMEKTTAQLTKRNLPWSTLPNTEATRIIYPVLTGALSGPNFTGYHHEQAGWVDASKAIGQLRDECLGLGVSFICGPAGTVVGFETESRKAIKAVQTQSGVSVHGEHFVLAAGAWASGLVPMYNSTLATAQAMAYLRLSAQEMIKYKSLPIYLNVSTGWFNFPPHQDTSMLKIAVHGWGYTRTPTSEERTFVESNPSSPPLKPRERPNFVPPEAEARLRQGLREILPEIAARPFDKVAMCWYTDTPTGDFTMDFHPDYSNLFVGGSGSGHAFKFLPVLGKYMSLAIRKQLSSSLEAKWRFRMDYKDQVDAFLGDGSRGGPARRELSSHERAIYDDIV